MGGRWEQWEATWNYRAQVGALGNKSELQGVRWKPQEAGGNPKERTGGRHGRQSGVSEDGRAEATVGVTHSYGSQVPRIC